MSRFLADAMLGRLARWLRAIGVDTLQFPVDARDRDLVARPGHRPTLSVVRSRILARLACTADGGRASGSVAGVRQRLGSGV
jgi:uncharacterized protein with PIN domain